MTNKKKEYHSIPYKSVVMFSAESASAFDKDDDLKVWACDKSDPFEKSLEKAKHIVRLFHEVCYLHDAKTVRVFLPNTIVLN